MEKIQKNKRMGIKIRSRMNSAQKPLKNARSLWLAKARGYLAFFTN